MKDKIIIKAGELFLKLGFKSVTMDDIANELGISKKTLYKYFNNKHSLVEETTSTLHESCLASVNMISERGYNAIEENFEIKKMFKEMFQNSPSSPIYQLKKYYPQVHQKTMEKEIVLFSECLKKNIEKGIKDGYYRKDTNVDLATQFYFSLVFSVHENTIENYKIPKLEQEVLVYHTRAIATEKGLQELNNQLKINQL
ncbi:TetR/AcrR family transcriptional regulator [Polaribacter aestuariivivens]|uniref:TetR/AcrR family transcriptional regulator n=1 Tax=Polaribacter aestuariivivens TaxID=2304626 RepID=A0A5S3NCU0_9FLAO|nr:TetR/AcrR family transcriptional regulator [Polaribacter aestuariivivens]TMM32414.1 TetR/AcrR family transcriptional regulator [Polaribacter aestuariivivens]